MSARKQLETLKLALAAMDKPTTQDIPDLVEIIHRLVSLLDVVMPEIEHDSNGTTLLS